MRLHGGCRRTEKWTAYTKSKLMTHHTAAIADCLQAATAAATLPAGAVGGDRGDVLCEHKGVGAGVHQQARLVGACLGNTLLNLMP